MKPGADGIPTDRAPRTGLGFESLFLVGGGPPVLLLLYLDRRQTHPRAHCSVRGKAAALCNPGRAAGFMGLVCQPRSGRGN